MSDSDPALLFNSVARALSDCGVGILHVDETADEPFDWTGFRACFSGPSIANSGYDLNRAVRGLDAGYADLVAFGRFFIANPDLVTRLGTGADLAMADRTTFYGGDTRGYTDYPALGLGTD